MTMVTGKRVVLALAALLGLTAVVVFVLVSDTSNNLRSSLRIVAAPPQINRFKINPDVVSEEAIVSKPIEPCQQQNNVVFIKTHKTGSTTTASIFDLYAYRNNLTVAVPPAGQMYMHRTEPFTRDMMAKVKKKSRDWVRKEGFNVFSSHARYNRPEMDAVVHDAKYVTILRDPASQFVSAFIYFHFDTRMERKLSNMGRSYSSALEEFLRDPAANIMLFEAHSLKHTIHNEQLFDLGMDPQYTNSQDAVNAYVQRLDKELDLVMIMEYMDQSLILLRDLMCWTTDDILYVPRKVRNTTDDDQISADMTQRIRQWNSADYVMYQHFNRTLWQRVAEYGPTFDDELQKFRDRLKTVDEEETTHHKRLINQVIKRMRQDGIYA